MVDPILFILITVLGVSLGIKVISTQNPVYSALYLVLVFILGSGIAFLLGLEFIALLFLLVYAGAIAVLVLFVVMMLDVKAVEAPWSVKKKRLLYLSLLLFLFSLVLLSSREDLQFLLKLTATSYVGSLVLIGLVSYEDYLRVSFESVVRRDADAYMSKIFQSREDRVSRGESRLSDKEIVKFFSEFLDERIDMWFELCDSVKLTEFLRLLFFQEHMESSYKSNKMWFVEFDSSCGLNDPSYLLYTTYGVLLIIAGVILLIAMVGAISLTLQKNCPESLYRQLGRESRNAIFSIKETKVTPSPIVGKLEASS